MKITTSKRFISALVLTTFCFTLFNSARADDSDKKLSTIGSKIKTIVIDAGHGGEDGSTHGAISKEKNVALAVALKLGKAIEDKIPGVRVVYTRTTDVFVKLYDRIGIANREKADLFISIHCNSMPLVWYKGKRIPDPTTRGTETFVAGFNRLDEQDVEIRENASILLEKDYKSNYGGFDPNDPESYIIFSLMKNAFRDQSIKLASMVQDEYIREGRINRGVKEKGLAVLQRAGMPAILTEIGFISNPEEERYINSDDGQAAIVNNIVNAIINYKKQVES
ncbi:N-acetylmuramoyl-L-alanine amidase [Pelobium sp.]|nr:N-acetylmuramoyl-L-alanine amidase [Pelobium sp.]MDA9554854.1 N-acetylmuramoyl-L-alanine amidase [Pelobium sp.]